MAVASAAAWGYFDHASGHIHSAAWIPVWNSTARLAFFLSINALVERVRQAHQRELTFASTDSLTGIANGRVFKERVNQTITQIRRHQRPFTVAYIDLDRFKQVNDTFGHAEGDRLLRVVATSIQGHLRASDLLARLGGDEFGIFMPGTGPDGNRASALGRAAGRPLGLGKPHVMKEPDDPSQSSSGGYPCSEESSGADRRISSMRASNRAKS